VPPLEPSPDPLLDPPPPPDDPPPPPDDPPPPPEDGVGEGSGITSIAAAEDDQIETSLICQAWVELCALNVTLVVPAGIGVQ
jgi:hypothetical protein